MHRLLHLLKLHKPLCECSRRPVRTFDLIHISQNTTSDAISRIFNTGDLLNKFFFINSLQVNA